MKTMMRVDYWGRLAGWALAGSVALTAVPRTFAANPVPLPASQGSIPGKSEGQGGGSSNSGEDVGENSGSGKPQGSVEGKAEVLKVKPGVVNQVEVRRDGKELDSVQIGIPASTGVGDLPGPASAPGLGSDIKALRSSKDFRKATEEFVAAQKELARKLRGASADEKARIKEQLELNKEKFATETQQLRIELHDRLEEIRRDLKQRGKPVDAGSGIGGGARGRGRE